jgi:hypothetical protein
LAAKNGEKETADRLAHYHFLDTYGFGRILLK